jgi:hypothetical protein
MPKTYTMDELFCSDWKRMDSATACTVVSLYDKYQRLKRIGSGKRIKVMAELLKNLCWRPKILRKLSHMQLLDVFADLEDELLKKEFYHFHHHQIMVARKIWQAPEPKLTDCTLEQIVWCDTYLSRLQVAAFKKQEDQARKNAQKFLSCLYCPVVDGKKKLFDPAQIVQFEDMDPDADVLALALVAFGYSMKFFEHAAPYLFPPSKERLQQATPADRGKIWEDLLYSAAELEVFGTVQQVAKVNVYTVLRYFNRKIKTEKQKR